ncbi:GNAT family N-acetyltransferase [uncultured Clostridium sp.]|uniref:GNAT family N-acetyltransferase n=1 Tax=uncultured Clostridium sp. TaxID=59620 RepID=UPI0025D0E455|nr:GNAT family N-acetyltransferase [uncultured Clostridium sp.]
MIVIERFKEDDSELMNKWKNTYEAERDIGGTFKTNKNNWIEKINECTNCKYWVINNGGIKIGMINLNHMDSEGCVLEYYIGDIHFRGRNITSSILWNMYNYIFDDLNMKYAVTIIPEDDKKNLKTLVDIGCEISRRFKVNELKKEKIKDMLYVLMKSEKWNNIKGEFNFEEISIEKI